MIYATANTDHYIPIRNLSTTHKHYTTDTDLCSTATDTYRTDRNLSTTTDPYDFRTHGSLSSTAIHLFRPHDNSWAAVQPYKTYNDLPADYCRTFRPDNTLWPTNTEPIKIRYQSWLNHYEPFTPHSIVFFANLIHGIFWLSQGVNHYPLPVNPRN